MKWIIKTANHSKGLVQSEINTLVNPSQIEWLFDCIALIKSDQNVIKRIENRSATAKEILSHPVILKKGELLEQLRQDNSVTQLKLDLNHIPFSTTFVVRHIHSGTVHEKFPTEWIEKRVGGLILNNRDDLTVNLTNPNSTLLIITWNGGTCLGWIHSKVSFDKIASRAPKMGPFFRGGGMKPRLCRTLVNLLYPLSPVIIDPFCGHGGILREIADMRTFGVGVEINKKLCRELLANNRHFGFEDVIAIIMGDSIKAPLRENAYDQAITDPPYAIQTTTKGLDREDLMLNWLEKQKKGLKLVFTTPKSMLTSLPNHWVTELDFDDFVHKSLTRRIRRSINRG